MKKLTSIIITSFLFIVSFLTASDRTEAGFDTFRQKNKEDLSSEETSKIKWENLETTESASGKIDNLEDQVKLEDLEMKDNPTVEAMKDDITEQAEVIKSNIAEQVEEWKR
ncbi:MAG: hypothetical protein JW938_06740 [Candidatus Omnitrophica bacterium]|nr:hypothetical protein [Candidatus Omnitrophota bacterium]